MMTEAEAREIVKPEKLFYVNDPIYLKAVAYLSGLEQGRKEKADHIDSQDVIILDCFKKIEEKDAEIADLRRMFPNWTFEYDKMKAALESSRQEIERLKEQRDRAFRMAESKNPQIDIIRENNRKLNANLEAERQSTSEILKAGYKLRERLCIYQQEGHVNVTHIGLKCVECQETQAIANWDVNVARHKAGGKA